MPLVLGRRALGEPRRRQRRRGRRQRPPVPVAAVAVAVAAVMVAGQFCQPGRVGLGEAAPVALRARGGRGGGGQVAVEAVEVAELLAASCNEGETCKLE